VVTNEPRYSVIKFMQRSKYIKYFFWYMIVFNHAFTYVFVRDIRNLLVTDKELPFRPPRKDELILAVIGKLVYISYFFIVPYHVMGYPLSRCFLMWLLCKIVASRYFVAVTGVNHHVESVHFWMTQTDRSVFQKDWGYIQCCGSADFAPESFWWNFFSGGLNHQTEHHLFPGVNHLYYPAICKMTREACKEFNVPFNSHPTLLAGLKSHFRLMETIGTDEHPLM